MAKKDKIQIVSGKPSTEDYLRLRETVGWHPLEKSRADSALNNSLMIVHAVCNDEVIGFGRVVGDGNTYFYIHDIIVDPNFQKQGIGTKIMKVLMGYIDKNAPLKSGAFIGLMIAEGLNEFYSRFGFEEFPKETPSMRIWRNGH